MSLAGSFVFVRGQGCHNVGSALAGGEECQMREPVFPYLFFPKGELQSGNYLWGSDGNREAPGLPMNKNWTDQ